MRWLGLVVFFVGCASSDPMPRDSTLPDLMLDPCAACSSNEICVQRFDGTCGQSTACVPRSAECPSLTCTAACQAAYCSSPYQCQNRPPCGSESSGAFTCYGP